SQKVRADSPAKAPNPSTAAIHATIRTPPRVDRSALRVTELKPGDRWRTRRLMRAQVSAEPIAQSAPKAESETIDNRKRPGQTARRAAAISRLSAPTARLSAATCAGYVASPVASL